MGSNLGELNLTLFGLNFSCGLNMNRWRNLAESGQLKG